MSEHPNVDLLRRGYDAFARGDGEALDALFTDDVVWNITGRNPVAGRYSGKPALFAHFASLAEQTAGTFALEVRDVLASDERGVVLTHATGERDGRTLAAEHIEVLRITDGRVAEFWSTSLDPYTEDEFWS